MKPDRMDAPMHMDATRFADLAAAFGGDLRRWPQAAREVARAWAEAHPVEAERALFEPTLIDAALHASPAPVVSMALRDRVIASASAAGSKARAIFWPGLKRLVWIGGAGWAAAACAGVVFGVTLNSHFATQVQAEAVIDQALLTGFDETEVVG